ncbi:hypothetical protein [Actinomadura sp. 9N407]|uniref:hypothetical protein n=1 Tax=Actinomadura sp. 9N407 TaxID=3375154 RepID=UPI00379D63C9
MISHRTRQGLWLGTVAACAVPPLYGWAAGLFGGSGYIFDIGVSAGTCPGWELRSRVWWVPGLRTLLAYPLLVAAPAFAVWAITFRRAGTETRTGRTAGWALLLFLMFTALFPPLAMAYDLGLGGDCRGLWGVFGQVTLAWDLAWLVPPTLLLAALWKPVYGRVLASAAVIAGLMAVLDADAWTDRTIASDRKACARMQVAQPSDTETPVQAISRMPWHARRLAFLCSARGHEPSPYKRPGDMYPVPGPQGRNEGKERSDGYLLGLGLEMCRRGSGPTRDSSPDELSVWQGPQGRVPINGAYMPVAYLCPDAIGRFVPRLASSEHRLREQRRRDVLEYEKERARRDVTCKARKYPGPQPLHEGTKSVSTSEGGGFFVTGSTPGTGSPDGTFQTMLAAIKDGLVSANGGGAAVSTAENTGICVTVRAYAKAPPVALKGWDRVAEVGFDVADEKLRIYGVEGDRGPSVPAVKGSGPYRMRVHGRGHDDDERYLIVYFPGASKEHKVYSKPSRP